MSWDVSCFGASFLVGPGRVSAYSLIPERRLHIAHHIDEKTTLSSNHSITVDSVVIGWHHATHSSSPTVRQRARRAAERGVEHAVCAAECSDRARPGAAGRTEGEDRERDAEPGMVNTDGACPRVLKMTSQKTRHKLETT